METLLQPAPRADPRVRILFHTHGEDHTGVYQYLASDRRVEVVRTELLSEARATIATSHVRLCFSTHLEEAIEIVREARRVRRAPRVVLLTHDTPLPDAVRAVRAGVDDVLLFPLAPQVIRQLLDDAARADGSADADRYHGVYSRHPRMKALFALVDDVGPTSTTVLIQGETGTGKEQLARAVHSATVGRGGPFVAVNCAAVPEKLLESELFGHEKGAFTGADRQRIGKFELADGGTLFLDEVGDVPAIMQVKLLRVLQERSFERVGGTDPVTVDVRVIAATNRPLKKMVHAGQFREDLYYRLNVIRMSLPPLRRRATDVPILAEHFCRKYARPGRPPKRLSAATLDQLAKYTWPGNIRELENAIERACVVNPGDVIEPAHLPPELRYADERILPARIDPRTPLKDLVREMTARLEKRYLVRALKMTRGHVGRAAKLCGCSRRSLTAKIAEYKIDRNPHPIEN